MSGIIYLAAGTIALIFGAMSFIGLQDDVNEIED